MVKLLSIFMCAVFAVCGGALSDFGLSAQTEEGTTLQTGGANESDTVGVTGENEAKAWADVPIIMYHSVCNSKSNDYVISTSKLDADLKYLKDRGYKTVFVSELINFVNGKGDLPAKPVVLSFDDGFFNNYSRVMPLMKNYGFKYSVSVVGKFIDNERGETVRNSIYSYLNFSDLKDMRDSGLTEFCNHTYDWHKGKGKRIGVRQAPSESDEEYKRELTADSEKCRKLIKKECGINMNVFTYPYGYSSKQTKLILKQLGYKAILTCAEGINRLERGNTEKLYNLRRYNRPAKYSTETFFKKVVKI